jgi:hypothetical protein
MFSPGADEQDSAITFPMRTQARLEPILQDYLHGEQTVEATTTSLASCTLAADPQDPEEGLDSLWNILRFAAIKNPEHQLKIIDILISLSRRNVLNDQGEPLTVDEGQLQVWKDLPKFGWNLRDALDSEIPAHPVELRQKIMTEELNLHTFMARLMATREPVFDGLDMFALWMLRELETPTKDMEPKSEIEAKIRIAAIWIEIVGVRIYGFNREFEHGPGKNDPGRGGPLWDGKHGFCVERWKLWRRRFVEVGKMDGEELAEEVRVVAREAETRMNKIEAGMIE